jgi:hypothetical protein
MVNTDRWLFAAGGKSPQGWFKTLDYGVVFIMIWSTTNFKKLQISNIDPTPQLHGCVPELQFMSLNLLG